MLLICNMFMQPEFTKKTRTNNNLPTQNLDSNNNFLRPVLSNSSVPLVYNHDHYIVDKNINNIDLERNFISSRNPRDFLTKEKKIQYSSTQVESIKKMNRPNGINYYDNSSLLINNRPSGPVQQSFQNTKSNLCQFQLPELRDDLEINNFLTRNPVNSRRDAMEKTRNSERKSFVSTQGGLMNNFVDFNLENTRKDKRDINTSSYLPMPRTLAIPKENV